MVTCEMYEEEFLKLKKMAVRLKNNRLGIKREERVGTGKFAKAYAKLRAEVATETVKYACMGIRQGLTLNNKCVCAADELIAANIQDIWLCVCRCEFDELNWKLEQLQQQILVEIVFSEWEMEEKGA